MKLLLLKCSGVRFAFNELTGQLVEFGPKFKNGQITIVPGDTDPKSLCQLLFDEVAVDQSWNQIDLAEAYDRLRKYTESKLGALIRVPMNNVAGKRRSGQGFAQQHRSA